MSEERQDAGWCRRIPRPAPGPTAPWAMAPGPPALPRAGGGNGAVLTGVAPDDRDFTPF